MGVFLQVLAIFESSILVIFLQHIANTWTLQAQSARQMTMVWISLNQDKNKIQVSEYKIRKLWLKEKDP